MSTDFNNRREFDLSHIPSIVVTEQRMYGHSDIDIIGFWEVQEQRAQEQGYTSATEMRAAEQAKRPKAPPVAATRTPPAPPLTDEVRLKIKATMGMPEEKMGETWDWIHAEARKKSISATEYLDDMYLRKTQPQKHLQDQLTRNLTGVYGEAAARAFAEASVYDDMDPRPEPILPPAPPAVVPTSTPTASEATSAILAAVAHITAKIKHPIKDKEKQVTAAVNGIAFDAEKALDCLCFALARHLKRVPDFIPAKAMPEVTQYRSMLPAVFRDDEEFSVAAYCGQFKKVYPSVRFTAGSDTVQEATNRAKQRLAEGNLSAFALSDESPKWRLFVSLLEEMQRAAIIEHIHYGTPVEFFLSMGGAAKECGVKSPKTIMRWFWSLEADNYVLLRQKGISPKKGEKQQAYASVYWIPSIVRAELTRDLIEEGDVYKTAVKLNKRQREVLWLALEYQVIRRRAANKQYWIWPRITPEIVKTKIWKEFDQLWTWIGEKVIPYVGWQRTNNVERYLWFCFQFYRDEYRGKPNPAFLRSKRLLRNYANRTRSLEQFTSPAETKNLLAQTLSL